MTTDSNRGTCRVCSGDFQLTANGRIRSHGPREKRCAGGSDLPLEAETTGQSVVNGMREAATETPTDRRPTASEYREARKAMASVDDVPDDVWGAARDVIDRATAHGVRPDPETCACGEPGGQHDEGCPNGSVTTTAANGTPMTVHGGPNPHRAPLPTGKLPLPVPLTQPTGLTTSEAIADAWGPAPQPNWSPDPAESWTAMDHPAASPGATIKDFASSFVSAAPAPKAPATEQPHRRRKGPEKSDFDQWGRYKLPDPATGKSEGRQRVTTFAKMISDQYGLSKWQQRQLLKGAVENPAIVAQARGLDVKVNATTMDTLADSLKDLAGSNEAAAKGTAFHTLTEDYDLGELGPVPVDMVPALEAYAAKLVEYGLSAVPEMIERTTMVRSLSVAGTLDRILQLPNGDHVIGDVKTGQDLTYGWLDIGVQLACYAHGVNENGVWDWETRTWLPAPKVRTDFAIVMHAPAGSATCQLYRVDLETGWANAVLAEQVREARKFRRHSVLLAKDGPEFIPLPPAVAAAEREVQVMSSFGNAGAAPEPLAVQQHSEAYTHGGFNGPEPAPAGVLERMMLVLSPEDAGALYETARTAGATPDQLAHLLELGTHRLADVQGALESFTAVRSVQEAGELYRQALDTFGADDPILPGLIATGTKALQG